MSTCKKIAVFAAVVLLSGCATCQQHPSLCAAGAVVLGTSIALSVQGSDKTDPGPLYRKPIIR